MYLLAHSSLQYKGSKVCFGVNISSSTRVKEPQPNSSEVPISLNPAFTFSKGAANSMEVYEAIYHPKLFEKARLDSTFKREIASVGLETVCKKFKISADNFEITEPFAKETPSSTDPTAAPPMPPSPLSAKELLAQLKDETLHERESPLPPLRPDTTPSKAAPLIQEISSPTVPTLSLAKPQYTMKNEKGLITLTVHLPDVQSIAEMDLDISEHDISLLAPEKYSLEVSFPCTVDDASVTAAFNKQFKMLEVTVRVRV